MVVTTPPDLDLDGVEQVVVLVAHPDDETLTAGGLLVDLPPDVSVSVVVASDGEASHPHSPTHTPQDLARLRRQEVGEAVRLLRPGADLHLLGLTDGGLTERVAEVVAATVPLVLGPSTLLVSTYHDDGHPDHEAIARAATTVAWRTDARLVEAPIWFWPWRGAEEMPTDGLRSVTLSERARRMKAEALELHTTQVRPLSDQPGDEVLLEEAALAHFRGPTERFVIGVPGERSPFEELHAGTADPWDVRTSWYERRKRALTLALLPHERYAEALEIGCSVGALAEDLLDRCDQLLAVDESAAAVRSATELLGDRAEVMQAMLPEEWDRLQGRTFDLVVVSEIGYFLSPGRLTSLADRVSESLAHNESATVLACHWRHEIVGWPMRGDEVHDRLDAHLGLRRRSQAIEDDVVLTVWTR